MQLPWEGGSSQGSGLSCPLIREALCGEGRPLAAVMIWLCPAPSSSYHGIGSLVWRSSRQEYANCLVERTAV
jgi:hypothetical protein